ncbi:substrate-binding domain-containing protein [Acidisoma silvae]|uniref:Substrate-binding domain-containing protein n=1 Tax=Acidisoma silvae TaxID=2802396 RepID=A0A963YTL3_9PROT|nr:substrate-binding domain-containing protein [Acidisoma silvae]MCB8876816.1 substrate-binding domain-containing protein [Acidisoma silvae]
MTEITRRAALRGTLGVAVTGLVAAPALAAQKPTFALIQINEQALFFNQMQTGAAAAAKAAGANLVIFNANDEPTAQNNAIEAYIQQKVQGIVVDAIDVNGLMPAIQEAAAAHIPVVAVDAVLPKGPQLAQVGVDNQTAGKMLADVFLPYVKSEMKGHARIGVVGALNSFIQNQRQSAFLDAIKGTAGVSVAGVVDGRNIQDTALNVAESLLTGNPDINTIYATGEPALLGAIAAVQSQGLQDKIKIFGWDLTAQAIAAIDAGYVVAVVQQDPEGMGRAAVQALAAKLKGSSVPATIPVPVTIVTKSNVGPFRAVYKA